MEITQEHIGHCLPANLITILYLPAPCYNSESVLTLFNAGSWTLGPNSSCFFRDTFCNFFPVPIFSTPSSLKDLSRQHLYSSELSHSKPCLEYLSREHISLNYSFNNYLWATTIMLSIGNAQINRTSRGLMRETGAKQISVLAENLVQKVQSNFIAVGAIFQFFLRCISVS